MKYILPIISNQGYSAEQVEGISVFELKSMLEDLDDADTIVLQDGGNQHGANYGTIAGEIELYEEDELA